MRPNEEAKLEISKTNGQTDNLKSSFTFKTRSKQNNRINHTFVEIKKICMYVDRLYRVFIKYCFFFLKF